MKRVLGILSIAVAAMPAAADNTAAQTSVELSGEVFRLSNDTPDWRAQSARITYKHGPRDVREVTLTRTSRFGLTDQQIGGVYSMPSGDRLTATLAANFSPSHRVLARHGVDASLQYEFAPAWLLHGGLGNNRYDQVNVNQGRLALEHYFSSFSVVAAWRPVRAFGVDTASSEFRANYYYADHSFVGVSVSHGREATFVNAGSVVLANVRSAALTGRHELPRHWAIRYALTHTRQGDFHSRDGVQLGVEYRF